VVGLGTSNIEDGTFKIEISSLKNRSKDLGLLINELNKNMFLLKMKSVTGK